MKLLAVCLVSSASVCTSAFSFDSRSSSNNGSNMREQQVSRRQVLNGAFVAASAVLVGAKPAFSDVSDGNVLPQGAAQFSRVLKIKSDLEAVRKRVAANSNEMDAKEWDNIGSFLRKVYSAGEDMKGIAAGISDPAKKKKAEEDIQLLQKYAKSGDLPVSKKDAAGYLAVSKQEALLLEDFFDLLSDVPDEI